MIGVDESDKAAFGDPVEEVVDTKREIDSKSCLLGSFLIFNSSSDLNLENMV